MSATIEENNLEELSENRTVDSLLDCLLFLTKYHKRESSADSIMFSLPIHNQLMDYSMFTQAANRLGLITKNVKRSKIKDITKLALPSVLLLDKNRACILLDYDTEKGVASTKYHHPGSGPGKSQDASRLPVSANQAQEVRRYSRFKGILPQFGEAAKMVGCKIVLLGSGRTMEGAGT